MLLYTPIKQKNIFFTGLILCSTLSQAQHFQVTPELEVDIYATLDLSTRWNSNSNDRKSLELVSGALSDSVLGIYSQYQLNSSTSLIAHLESAVDLVGGEFIDKEHKVNQAAWLGISNFTLGEFRYGRQYTVGQAFVSKLEIGSWQDLGIGALLRAADNYQVQKQFSWRSNEQLPMQLGLSYSHDIGHSTNPQHKKATLYSLATRYVTESIYIAASFEQIDGLKNIEQQSLHPTAIQLGGKYSTAQHYHFSAAWSRQKNGFVGLNGNENPYWGSMIGLNDFLTGGQLDAVYFAAATPVKNGEVQIQYSQAKAKFQHTESPNHTAKVMSLGYIYPYSKQLSLYSYLAHARNYAPEEFWLDTRSKFTRLGLGVKYEF